MIDQKFQSVPGGPFINVVGQTGTGNSFLSDNQPTAEWQGTLSATYNQGPVSVTGQMRYVSDGIMDYLGALPGETCADRWPLAQHEPRAELSAVHAVG